MSVPSEQKLREAIDSVFGKYDTDGSGTLDSKQVTTLINDALKHMTNPRVVSAEEVKSFMGAVDTDGSGTISKTELLAIFKKVLGVK